MNVRLATPGIVLNSGLPGHRVRVEDDRGGSGGFLVYEWWEGSGGPNPRGAFDSWVEDERSLETFFAEAGWSVEWEEC